MRKVVCLGDFAHNYICTFDEKDISLHSNLRKQMNLLKAILLGGAAYLAFKGGKSSAKSQVEELNDQLDELAAEVIKQDEEMDNLRSQYEGNLQNRLECWLTVHASRITWWGNNWNSQFDLRIKNIGTTPCNIIGIRVFWTCEGRKSILVPWTTSAYTIQPGKSVTVRLSGFENKHHFGTVNDIKVLEEMFKSSGKSGDEFIKHLPLICEADIIESSNGEQKAGQLKNFAGELIAVTDGRIYYPHHAKNGTEVEEINRVVSPSNGKE